MPHFRLERRTYEVDAFPFGEGYRVRLPDGREVTVDAVEALPHALRFRLAGRWYTVARDVQGKVHWLTWAGQTYRFEVSPPHRHGGAEDTAGGDGVLRAPMPGQVRAVRVAQGEQVQRGQVVLLLEAMKMEIRVQAPFAGTVTRLEVREGDVVERDAILAEITPMEAEDGR